MLTLVALQLTATSGLPDVNYLILLDKLYILSYAFVVLTMAVMYVALNLIIDILYGLIDPRVRLEA